jgi:hypothetical protein
MGIMKVLDNVSCLPPGGVFTCNLRSPTFSLTKSHSRGVGRPISKELLEGTTSLGRISMERRHG